MDEHDRMTVLLPPELARSVREAVDGRRYLVESDVVIDALNDWQIKQQIRARKLEQLRELVSDGIASGFEPLTADDFERIKREGRAVLAARKTAE